MSEPRIENQKAETSSAAKKYKFKLFVHVHDSETGKPIEGAEVDPHPHDSNNSNPAPIKTDKNGIAEFELKHSGCAIYDVNIDHADYYSESTTVFVTKKGAGHPRVSLERESRKPASKTDAPTVLPLYSVNLHVHVSDYATGNPIIGASVDPNPRYDEGTNPVAAPTLSPEGVASFNLQIDGGPEKYDIYITHPDYTSSKIISYINSSADKHEYKTLFHL